MEGERPGRIGRCESRGGQRSVLVVDLKGLYGRAVHCDEKSARRGHRDRDQPSSRRKIWQGLQLAGFNVYCESQKADCPITATVQEFLRRGERERERTRSRDVDVVARTKHGVVDLEHGDGAILLK